jgi:hypothetical protein
LANEIKLVLQVQLVLEKLGFTTNDADLVYTTLSTTAQSAVTSGDYLTALNNKLLDLGSDAFVTVDTAAFVVNGYTSAITRTPRPSSTPTAPPTRKPTINPHSGGRGSDTRVVTIIVVVTVIGTAAILASLMVGAYYEQETKRRQKVAPADEPAMEALVPT